MSEDKQRIISRKRFDILSLFPGVFDAFLHASILGIAEEKGLVEYHLHDIRDYSEDKHKKVDARPYGGGPGMVMRCEPVFRAFEAVMAMDERPCRAILLTPQGETYRHETAAGLAEEERVLVLCGHYEGFDERIREHLPVEEISIGDYVLSGGEAAAMVIVDSIVRLIPGVLGHQDSTSSESFSGEKMLEYPQYTRPASYRGVGVPEVLMSGNHKEIEKWRRREAEKRTRERRLDLWDEETQDSE